MESLVIAKHVFLIFFPSQKTHPTKVTLIFEVCLSIILREKLSNSLLHHDQDRWTRRLNDKKLCSQLSTYSRSGKKENQFPSVPVESLHFVHIAKAFRMFFVLLIAHLSPHRPSI